MKILYYSPNPHLGLNDPSGYGTHMCEMIEAMRKLGHEVIPFIAGGEQVVAATTHLTERKRLVKRFIPKYIWSSLRDWQLLRKDRFLHQQLLALIKKEKPDLIYERASHLQLSGVEAAAKLHVRHVLEVNAPLAEEKVLFGGGSWFDSKAVKTERTLLTGTSRILVVSSALRDYYVKRHALDESRFAVIPNAIPKPEVMLDPEGVEIVRLRYNLMGKTVIGFVGSIFPWHGVDLMLKAFANVASEFPTSVLLVVGDGVVLPELRRLAEDLKLTDRVHFTGNVPHHRVNDHIACMDICVMARSNWYGSPVKIFEYGLLAKAIVAPNTAPVIEVMEQGKDGILVAPEVADIAAAFKVFLKDPALRNSMGLAFQAKVKTKHTWRINALRSLD